ncbi:MAG: SPFH domain-containing protein [Ruminococcus sp.]|nr:SPFH domain-containing protein [Ruminococcus sp.]
MGLIKAASGSAGGVMADQWKEYFYCDSLPSDVLMRKGQKRISGRSSNTKGVDNIITSGSVIAVSHGQCMIIVEQGKVVEFCAEPGEFIFDSSTEPTIFEGGFDLENLKKVFSTVGKRFTFGGEAPKDQRVYYFNTKEILENKFGTPNPIMFEMYNSFINMRRTINLRFNGTYTYIISNPMLFYTKLCGNVEYEATRELIDGQLKADFVDALQPAVGTLTEQEIRPAQLTQKVNILKEAMNAELVKWNERGISIKTITINPITLNKEDLEKIQEMEDAATLGSNPQMMAGRTVTATAEAMQTAAGNSAGAMTGFMGMGMVGGTMGGSGGFAAAQSMYAMNQQQQAQNQPQQQTAGWTCSCGQSGNIGKFCQECGKPQPADSNGWTCSCGAVNKGKFCAECGKPKPAGAPQYKCDKCGWEPDDPTNPPKFCPECGDPFDDGDIKG